MIAMVSGQPGGAAVIVRDLKGQTVNKSRLARCQDTVGTF